ncbi:MAG: ATP-binding protein, partial [Acidimicrobiia bacterium]|nr:ATP-binding protein [Acidimicrobiia bacterium]
MPDSIVSDSMRIEQVVTNLMSNAMKFTEQGSVRVRVRNAGNDDRLPGGGMPATGSVAVEVSDTGVGIPADKLEKVFRAFEQADGSTTRKFGGTGLGLAISREMARLLGGEIVATSEEGEGSTFTLIITPASAGPGSVEPAVGARPAPLRGNPVPAPAQRLPRPDDRNDIAEGEPCVVIVEDDPVFVGILMDVVRERGYKVVANLDGPSGIEAVRRFRPIGVILDVNLPKADGWTVMEAIKSDPATRHIPVHFVSADDEASRAGNFGAIGFSVKPVDREELHKAMVDFENLHNDPVRQILVIESDEKDHKLIEDTLGGEGLQLTFVTSAEQGLQHLRENSYHCVVLEQRLRDCSGEEFLEQVVAEGLTLPPV